MSTHLRPTAPIAADVLLPSDPGLALTLAQALLDSPLMSNHSHGLWGYSGSTPGGRKLTVQASGIGGPSAAVVLGELCDHGARRAIRVGRATALDPELEPGDLLVVGKTVGGDGASAALGVRRPQPDRGLTATLSEQLASAPVLIASSDLFHDPESRRRGWRRAGARAVDLESGAALAVGAEREVAVAACLAIAETAAGQLDEAATESALIRLAAACVGAFERPDAAQVTGGRSTGRS